jgi:hypothetical protein
MKKIILVYSLKLWLTVAAISLLLFQVPLFYLQYSYVDSITGSGRALWLQFFNNWGCVILVLMASWFVAFYFVKSFYQPYWSARGFKLALLLVSQALMLLSLAIYFTIYNLQYVLPTLWVLLIFALSYAISVHLYHYKNLRNLLYLQKIGQE